MHHPKSNQNRNISSNQNRSYVDTRPQPVWDKNQVPQSIRRARLATPKSAQRRSSRKKSVSWRDEENPGSQLHDEKVISPSASNNGFRTWNKPNAPAPVNNKVFIDEVALNNKIKTAPRPNTTQKIDSSKPNEERKFPHVLTKQDQDRYKGGASNKSKPMKEQGGKAKPTSKSKPSSGNNKNKSTENKSKKGDKKQVGKSVKSKGKAGSGKEQGSKKKSAKIDKKVGKSINTKKSNRTQNKGSDRTATKKASKNTKSNSKKQPKSKSDRGSSKAKSGKVTPNDSKKSLKTKSSKTQSTSKSKSMSKSKSTQSTSKSSSKRDKTNSPQSSSGSKKDKLKTDKSKKDKSKKSKSRSERSESPGRSGKRDKEKKSDSNRKSSEKTKPAERQKFKLHSTVQFKDKQQQQMYDFWCHQVNILITYHKQIDELILQPMMFKGHGGHKPEDRYERQLHDRLIEVQHAAMENGIQPILGNLIEENTPTIAELAAGHRLTEILNVMEGLIKFCERLLKWFRIADVVFIRLSIEPLHQHLQHFTKIMETITVIWGAALPDESGRIPGGKDSEILPFEDQFPKRKVRLYEHEQAARMAGGVDFDAMVKFIFSEVSAVFNSIADQDSELGLLSAVNKYRSPTVKPMRVMEAKIHYFQIAIFRLLQQFGVISVVLKTPQNRALYKETQYVNIFIHKINQLQAQLPQTYLLTPEVLLQVPIEKILGISGGFML